MNWEVCSHLKSPWGTHASVAFPFVCDCAICVFAAMPLLPGPRGEKERPNLLGDWTNGQREACNLLGRMSPLSLLSPLPLHCCFIRNVFSQCSPSGQLCPPRCLRQTTKIEFMIHWPRLCSRWQYLQKSCATMACWLHKKTHTSLSGMHPRSCLTRSTEEQIKRYLLWSPWWRTPRSWQLAMHFQRASRKQDH